MHGAVACVASAGRLEVDATAGGCLESGWYGYLGGKRGMMVDQELMDAVAELAATAGYSGPLHIERWRSSSHNRLLRVTAGTTSLALKRYFTSPFSRRERLRAEFTFSRYAWARGLRNLPEPIAADYTRCMALYGFVDGTPPRAEEIGTAEINAAVDFVARLNVDPTGLDARALPPALKSTVSGVAAVEQIDARLTVLRERAVDPRVEPSLRQWIEDQLVPALLAVARTVHALEPSPAGGDRRCVSPSDFGFHNALRGSDGPLIFVDFEYAGWDDPTRLVAEMFSQVELPLPASLLDPLAEGIAAVLGLAGDFAARVRAYLPLLRIERCCDLLHELLPTQGRRSPSTATAALATSAGRRLALQQALHELLGAVSP